MAGVLSAASYFTGPTNKEVELRKLAEILYRGVDWQWALDKGATLSHGWKPESGFLPYRWDKGYSEAIILYALALGSPTFPVEPQGYKEWISTFEWLVGFGRSRSNGWSQRWGLPRRISRHKINACFLKGWRQLLQEQHRRLPSAMTSLDTRESSILAVAEDHF
jgi:hypothetical protein